MPRGRLSVTLDVELWEQVRGAYVADLDDGGPATLVAWLVAAIGRHLERSPAQRATIAVQVAELIHSGPVHRVLVVESSLLDQVAAAIREERREAGRMVSRSQWVREAAAAASASTIERVGVLPAAPAELVRGPRPRV